MGIAKFATYTLRRQEDVAKYPNANGAQNLLKASSGTLGDGDENFLPVFRRESAARKLLHLLRLLT